MINWVVGYKGFSLSSGKGSRKKMFKRFNKGKNNYFCGCIILREKDIRNVGNS